MKAVKVVRRGRVRDMSRLDVEIRVRLPLSSPCVVFVFGSWYAVVLIVLSKQAFLLLFLGIVLFSVHAQAMGMLQHPHVVNLEEVLQTDEHVFLVMDLCGGGCLFDALPEDVRLIL